MDDISDVMKNILKSLPEPEVYEMPPDYFDREMMKMWPRMIIRDRFTWVAKQNVLIYRWAKICMPYLKGEKHDPPSPALSSVLRPTLNQYESAITALAGTLGKFRPHDVPLDESEDMIVSTRGLMQILHDLAPAPVNVCEEAFNSFVHVWNNRSTAHTPQADFIVELKERARDYLKSITPVWTAIFEIESQIAGRAKSVQLELTCVERTTEDILAGIDIVQQQLHGTVDTLGTKIDEAQKETVQIVENSARKTQAKVDKVDKHITSIGRKVDTAKSTILKELPNDGNDVKSAMRERAREQIKKNPKRSIRAVCLQVFEEYRDIRGAYATPDALRKQLGH